MSLIFTKHPIVCSECGFASTDLNLVGSHSCDIANSGGRCEDYPCCGHEFGDCNGELYGSTEAIQANPHLLCDHETGYCNLWDEENDDDEDGGWV